MQSGNKLNVRGDMGGCGWRGRWRERRFRCTYARGLRSTAGQMTVELAVCIPVIIVVAAIAINVMVYLNVCARFDRIAAEAVRTQAASPGYGEYGASARVGKVKGAIEGAFSNESVAGNLSFNVAVEQGGADAARGNEGGAFSMSPRLETYICKVKYRPWGFLGNVFGMVDFMAVTHESYYTIDPFKPGVLA